MFVGRVSKGSLAFSLPQSTVTSLNIPRITNDMQATRINIVIRT